MSNESLGYTELGSMRFHSEPSRKKGNVNKDLIKKWVLIAIVAAVAMIIVFGMVKLISGGSYEAAVKEDVELFNGEVNENYEAAVKEYIELFNGEVNGSKFAKQYPEFMAETIEEFCDNLEADFEAFIEEMDEFGKDEFGEAWEDAKGKSGNGIYKFTYEIIDKTKLNDEEIEEYRDIIREYAGEGEKIKIQTGYRFDVKMKGAYRKQIKSLMMEIGEEMEDYEENVEIVVLKCNGKIGVWGINDNYIWERY